MKALRTMLVLAVLVIATVALTGVATAATAGTITANTPYVGRPVITNVPGLAGYITGYVYDTPLTYTVTDADGNFIAVASAAEVTFVDGKAVYDGEAYDFVKPVDKTLHTLSGPAPAETSILFENGKPVKTVTAAGETGFDATFYKDIAVAMGLTDQLIPHEATLNSWNLWML